MQLHQIQPKTKSEPIKRIGRGGKRGKTSGRGHKGQKARSGNSTRPYIRDILKKIPKLRGHGKNRARTVNSSTQKARTISLGVLESVAQKGMVITPQKLSALGVIAQEGGKYPKIKIVSTGEITKAVTIKNCSVSKVAEEKIVKVGGSVRTHVRVQ